MYLSYDEGKNWTDIYENFPKYRFKGHLKSFLQVKNILFVCIENYYNANQRGIFMSADQGKNWKNIDANLGDFYFNEIAIIPFKMGVLELYNATGQKITNYSFFLGQQSNQFDLIGIPQGMYFYQVKLDQKIVQNGKIIISN
ncbi:MAG: Secretion system C-terminal sorting domain [Bacteroidota bacterium]|jgi:hypothetical protein